MDLLARTILKAMDGGLAFPVVRGSKSPANREARRDGSPSFLRSIRRRALARARCRAKTRVWRKWDRVRLSSLSGKKKAALQVGNQAHFP